MRLASKCKTVTRCATNLLKTMFSSNELRGRGVYGSHKKNPLDRNKVEYLKQTLITLYGEAQITDKVWSDCVAAMNAHLRKYQKDN